MGCTAAQYAENSFTARQEIDRKRAVSKSALQPRGADLSART
jgi:hypothetical protein